MEIFPNRDYTLQVIRKEPYKIVLYIYDDETLYPHCHIIGLGKDGKKEVCVRLDKADYFCHGGKQSKFTSDEKEMFINFINSKTSLGTTRWIWAAETWNGFAFDNENMLPIKTDKTPNYNLLDVEK